MTILICGASGLVGKELCKLLEKKKIIYYGTYNSNKIDKKNMFKIDFLNLNTIEKFLKSKEITCCVFLIVQRLTDVCENNWNETKKINIEMVNNTSFICDKLNIKFIHLSTDYVFDGIKQPNYPTSLTNPLQNYGISKLLSEHKVMRNCKKYCIIRTPVLYSSLSKIHNNAVTLIAKNIMDLRKKERKEDNYCIRRPVYIPDLCEFIIYCFQENINGLYHFYNPINKCTKYKIGTIISQFLNIDYNHITPNNKTGEGLAARPYDTQLFDKKYNINDFYFTDFKDTIKYCFNRFKHPSLKTNARDFFLLIDLDGTLINSNLAHYNSYRAVFKERNTNFITFNEWNKLVENNTINKFIIKKFGIENLPIIKSKKYEKYKKYNIQFSKNCEKFLNFIIKYNINYCIVTNSSINSVKINKQKLPLLQKLTKWVIREDYHLPKPNSECYQLAVKKYYNNEKFIVGIEDTYSGFLALKNITNIIFINNNINLFKNEDCYLFDDFNQILN